MAYNEDFKNECLNLIASGVNSVLVSKQMNVSRPTLTKWIKQAKQDSVNIQNAIQSLEKKINILSNKKDLRSDDAILLSELIIALNKLKGEDKKKKELSSYVKPPINLDKTAKILRDEILSKGGLFEYQKNFLACEAQFRIVLKSRQIGFSYVAAADALIGAIGGRNQLFLSASEEQALILMRYLRGWAERFGIVLDKDSETEITLENGAIIKALAHNFRTVQGFTGDIWMDEFAWYANPKKIWHAFVPSIGAIKGRLTILSTPFEEKSLFHELYSDEAKYKMFERFRVDIYTAIKDGLEFDLETMKALFDADTWASAYECVFIDDESSLLSISLIKSCIDESYNYYTPASDTPLLCGYDIGRVNDRSTLASVVSIKDNFVLASLGVFAKASFKEQEDILSSHLRSYPLATLEMDKTGIGLNLTETMRSKFKSRVHGVYFTNSIKEQMALNLKKLFEDKKIKIPNDAMLISDLHAIKRSVGAKSFKYDAKRNEYGHADRFWALALACKKIAAVTKRSGGGAMII
ncbi:terminase large subunit domain-containing protein [Campylobacter pinnipediorum]|uniref:terminase large subunit domain-containing protein n=1 Tax=Campylobacter pinnipediorum TaxID=1965231 RepID=UPI000995631F|nr:terminase family protein [Campylobacter pinnipediorum]AQW83333.1 terminase domain protein [Campylobacter pinnipediorum subsp. pinnipediorum]